MEIKTKYLGDVAIDRDKLITFDTGLPGFEAETQFVLLDFPGNELLQIMQSTQTPNLAFIVTNPHYFFEDYAISLNEHIQKKLDIKSKEDVVILTILTIRDPFPASTINLKAPLVINILTRRAKQYIVDDNSYAMQEKIPLHAMLESGD